MRIDVLLIKMPMVMLITMVLVCHNSWNQLVAMHFMWWINNGTLISWNGFKYQWSRNEAGIVGLWLLQSISAMFLDAYKIWKTFVKRSLKLLNKSYVLHIMHFYFSHVFKVLLWYLFYSCHDVNECISTVINYFAKHILSWGYAI